MVKKLRYYARFIVVCLLLKKMKLVRDLVRELAKHIDEYTATYEPEDQVLLLTEHLKYLRINPSSKSNPPFYINGIVKNPFGFFQGLFSTCCKDKYRPQSTIFSSF